MAIRWKTEKATSLPFPPRADDAEGRRYAAFIARFNAAYPPMNAKHGDCEARVSRWPLQRGGGDWHVGVRSSSMDQHAPSHRWWRKSAAEAKALAERELGKCARRTKAYR